MAQSWERLIFETLELGVSSAVDPELLPDNQAAWGMNIDCRGGKPGTRPNLASRLILPPGLIQGCEYFGVQNGMLVASIAGNLWRIRITGSAFSYESIPLTFPNSPLIKQVWMTQTVETLVIQDGQSDPILYNGSVAPRAGPTQVPRGRQMAYGNGRLWVAVDANNVQAGDIRTGAAGSELYFLEATYLTGGGKLFFSSDINGMGFIPVTGQSDYGALLVFGARETNAIRADITSRDDWGRVPGFVTSILRSVGSASQWSLTSVNQDLYWRDSNGGIRSIRNALADEAGPGSAPISREVSRLTDYDSQQLLGFCSSIYFDNRLLMTSSPYLMENGGIGWKDLISLDFAPLSSMGGKSQPAYNGKWNGLNFVKMVAGEFGGKNRAFVLTTDDNGINELWELDTGNRADLIVDCTDGTALMQNPISCFVEYPRRNFGESKRRKRLARCDVWLSGVDGTLDLSVYWRSDNSQKWLQWDEAPRTCAQTTDPATTTPHVWKNLLPQERPQFKTFTIPDAVNDVIKYAAQVGFEFQIRLAWTGRCRIDRMMLMADVLDDPDYADRTGYDVECVENDVSGNDQELTYVLRTNCDDCVADIEVQPVSQMGEPGEDIVFSVTATSPTPGIEYQWQYTEDDGASWTSIVDGSDYSGALTDELTVHFTAEIDGRFYRCLVILPGCSPSTGGGSGGTHRPGLAVASEPAAIIYLFLLATCSLFTGATRGGTYQLIGVSEFINPSIPPKKYRRNSCSGTMKYYGPGCGPLFLTRAYSGSISYNAITGIPVDNRCVTDNNGPCNPSGTPPAGWVPGPNYWTAPANGGYVGFGTPPNTSNFEDCDRTTSEYSGTGLCIDWGAFGGFRIVDGETYAQLDTEDTDQDAILRLLPSSPWSAYGVSPTAQWESRGAGDFDAGYQEARWKATAAVPEGVTRFIRVALYRRQIGTVPYVQIAVMAYPMMGGPGDTASISDIPVPNDIQGYETYAECLPIP